jgi:hypothetical protein
MQMQNQ